MWIGRSFIKYSHGCLDSISSVIRRKKEKTSRFAIAKESIGSASTRVLFFEVLLYPFLSDTIPNFNVLRLKKKRIEQIIVTVENAIISKTPKIPLK